MADTYTFTYRNSRKVARVESIADAAQFWNRYRDEQIRASIGSRVLIGETLGNGGTVRDADGEIVATISYNGRVWVDGVAIA